MISDNVQIIATVGPVSNTKETLMTLALKGVSVFRLNFSSGNHIGHKNVIKFISEIENEIGKPLLVFQDLCGHRFTCSSFENQKTLLLKGQKLILASYKQKNFEYFSLKINSKSLFESMLIDCKTSQMIFIDGGRLKLIVIEIRNDCIVAELLNEGTFYGKKDIYFLDTILNNLSTFTEKDEEDILFGIENSVNWISCPYLKDISDINNLRLKIASSQNEIKIVSKIENNIALKNLDSIADESDLIIFDRDLLSTGTTANQSLFIQKSVFKALEKYEKPIIGSLGTLDSFFNNESLSVSETSDIINYILDGASYILMKGITSVGEYPNQAVDSINKIIQETINYQNSLSSTIRIKTPLQLRTLLIQYFNFFNDYIGKVNTEFIELKVVPYSDGIELSFSKTKSSDWIVHFQEYLSFIDRSIFDINIEFKSSLSIIEKRLFYENLGFELDTLKHRIKLKEDELNYLKYEMIPFLQNSLITLNSNRSIITNNYIDNSKNKKLKKIMENNKYKTEGNVGILGDNVSVTNFTQNNLVYHLPANLDLRELSFELQTLKNHLQSTKDENNDEHLDTLSNIIKAEKSANNEDRKGVVGFLKQTGKWALDAATEIGTSLAAEVIKKSMGI